MKLHEQAKLLLKTLEGLEDNIGDYRSFLWGPKFTGYDTDGTSKDWIRTGEVTNILGQWRNEIQEALRHVMAGRTTLIIAHRTSTLALADLVVFLEDGSIAGVGTHEELLRTIPRYGEVLAHDDRTAAGGVR